MKHPKPAFDSWDRNDYVSGKQCNFIDCKIDQPVEFIGYLMYPQILDHPKHGEQLNRCIGLVGQWVDVLSQNAISVYFKDIDETIPMDVRWLAMLIKK